MVELRFWRFEERCWSPVRQKHFADASRFVLAVERRYRGLRVTIEEFGEVQIAGEVWDYAVCVWSGKRLVRQALVRNSARARSE